MFQHVKNFVKCFLIFLIDLPITILGILLTPFACLFVNKNNHLPKIFKWMETYDNDMNGDGIAPEDDPVGHPADQHLPLEQRRRGGGWKGWEHSNGKFRSYKWRVLWLLRNPVNTWAYVIIGCNTDNEDVKYEADGELLTTNSWPAKSGFLYARCYTEGKMYPVYYYVRQWGNSKKCLRIYIGWKFRQARPLDQWEKGGRKQFVFNMNPFMTFMN